MTVADSKPSLFYVVELIILLILSSTAVNAADFVKKNSKSAPQVYQQDGVAFTREGNKIPAYKLFFDDATENKQTAVSAKNKKCTNILNNQKYKFAAYSLGSNGPGCLAVPIDWIPTKALFSADGGTLLEFKPKNDLMADTYIRYIDYGSCFGCIVSKACLFFSDAKKQAKQNDFECLLTSDEKELKSFTISKERKGYSFKYNKLTTHGVAYYNSDPLHYIEYEIRVPNEGKALTTLLLNQFSVN